MLSRVADDAACEYDKCMYLLARVAVVYDWVLDGKQCECVILTNG